jgi:hypothetical protein
MLPQSGPENEIQKTLPGHHSRVADRDVGADERQEDGP